MDRRYLIYGLPALAIILIAAGLQRYCGESPVVSPPAQTAPTAFPEPATKRVSKRIIATKKPGLVAPRLLNLDELQTNIRKYYPEAEHRAGKEGHVIMALVIGADGSVGDVRVETSGGADFDAAARKVVLAMRFSPARSAGASVPVEINEGIDFQFDGK
jgi:protein TonB